ncbi:ChaC-like protein [Syncephalis fuscata]|nr:ChaC-like protein [Syncephalis fuscata]
MVPRSNSTTTAAVSPKEMWVFGYGSLIWKVDFPYEKRVPGFIRGHVRRFWQASSSTDHRGTEAYPGRVVTLVPQEEWSLMNDHVQEEGEVTWGVAYKIADDKIEEVRAHLDYREKNGYTTHYVDVFQSENRIPVAMIYIGTTSNSEFCGPESVDQIAERIAKAIGPSGPNQEYLFNLCGALRLLAPQVQDVHLFELEARVKQLQEQLQQQQQQQ